MIKKIIGGAIVFLSFSFMVGFAGHGCTGEPLIHTFLESILWLGGTVIFIGIFFIGIVLLMEGIDK
jgi:hypothetical protein